MLTSSLSDKLTESLSTAIEAGVKLWLIRCAVYLVCFIGLVALGTCIAKAIWNWKPSTKHRPRKYTETQTNWNEHYAKLAKEQENTAVYPAYNGKWSPTGWTYDKNKQEWQPPNYLQKESQNRWKWDEEKRIWIDLTKAEVTKTTHQADPDIKIMRNGPTYEEWKNQHYKGIYEKLTDEAKRREQEKANPRD